MFSGVGPITWLVLWDDFSTKNARQTHWNTLRDGLQSLPWPHTKLFGTFYVSYSYRPYTFWYSGSWCFIYYWCPSDLVAAVVVPASTSGVGGLDLLIVSVAKSCWMKTKGLLIFETWRLTQIKGLYETMNSMGSSCWRKPTVMMGRGFVLVISNECFTTRYPEAH